MFSHQHNIPKQHYRVETYPGLAELVKCIQQTQKIKGVKHCFYWVDEKAVQYTLSMHLKKATEEIEWWMHESSVAGQRMIWFYRTNDLGVIYPQILAAVGAPPPLASEAPPEETTTLLESLGGIKYSTPGTKYNTPGSTIAAQQAANRPPLSKLISGTLETLPMSSILQIASKEDATGKLLIESPEGEGVVVFLHGRPVHATTQVQTGLEGLLELCTWMSGKITFTQGTKADTTTIQQSVEQISYLSAQLIENIGFLQENAVDDMSILTRSTNVISEQAFEKRILEGPPLGLDLQKRFFQQLDGNRTLKDVSTLLSLNPSQWIAIATNLLRLGLVLTPDGRCVLEDPYAQPSLPATQSTTGSHFPATKVADPQTLSTTGQFSNSQNQQSTGSKFPQATSGTFPTQPPSQGTSGQFPKNPPSQATSGSFPLNPQTTSGQFRTGAQAAQGGSWGSQAPAPQTAAQGGSWGNQAPAPQTATPLVPPSSSFGAGTGAGGGSNLPSPAVAAFMSATSTIPELETVHIGIETHEVMFSKTTPRRVSTLLTDPATNIFTYESMQFFLDREFARSFRFGATFSLMVFCMKLRAGEKPAVPSSKIVELTVDSINKIKHDVDIFGHFGERGYALILPNQNAGLAATLVDKISTNLTKFAPELAQVRPTFFFGIASVPTDAKDIEAVVANAQKAMQEAVRRNVTRVMFGDIGR